MTEETAKQFKEWVSIIQPILEQYEQARNDDKFLIWKVFEHFKGGRAESMAFVDFVNLPPFESITRCRRYIQNKLGLFQPTDPDVIKRRSRQEKEIKDLFGGKVL